MFGCFLDCSNKTISLFNIKTYLYMKNYVHIDKGIEDLALASTLYYLGFSIIRIEEKGNPKVSFIFEKSNELEDTIGRYWDGLLLVDPKLFWGTVRELKSRVKGH